jgi:tripartite-type tricarboxylate transporter receptor subunit TctC
VGTGFGKVMHKMNPERFPIQRDRYAHEASHRRGATMRATSSLIVFAAILVVALVGTHAAAQESYPTRPVLLTHGFAAGGNGDVVSRIVGDALSPRLGQPVIIEPRPGAGGNTASARLAKAEPDGYTLITLTGGHAVSAAIYKTLQFDPLDDFQMVSVYGYQAFMVAVRKDSASRPWPT